MLHWFAKRLREMQEVRRDERGFTLIELLVVVIIIGILAAIAIPTFLSQRDKAYTSATKSDLRNAVIATEAKYAQDGAYATSVAQLNAQGFRASDGVTITFPTPNAAAGAFCLQATNTKGGTSPMFASDNNRVPSGTSCT